MSQFDPNIPGNRLQPVAGGKENGAGAEIDFAERVPIPPNVRQAIILSGSDYEIRYQWFQQYVQIFGSGLVQESQRRITDTELTALKASQWYIKEYTPEFIDIMKGMADGATDGGVPLSYAETLACFTGKIPFHGTEPPDSEEGPNCRLSAAVSLPGEGPTA